MSSMTVKLPPGDTVNGSYFIKFAANKTSQGGEDGVLAKIFDLMKLNEKPRRMCVDVGAWNGIHLSNSYSLCWDRDYPWDGVLIEADDERCQEMKALYAEKPNVICVNKHVDVYNHTSKNFDSGHLLKNILQEANVPLDFDFLSIDVDGADYHLWHQLSTRQPGVDDDVVYVPKVVCVEFNPSIPNCIYFVQECDTRVHQGNSLLALFELGTQLGYELVATTTFNAIFVRKDQYVEHILPELERVGVRASPSLMITQQQSQGEREVDGHQNNPYPCPGVKSILDILHPPASMYTYMFQTYDGELKFAGSKKLIWHKLALNPQKLQILPVRDRKFPYEPQYEVLLGEVQLVAKAFLVEWKHLGGDTDIVTDNAVDSCARELIVDVKVPLGLIESVVAASAKLLPVTCIRGRLMEILTSLVYTVNAEAMIGYFSDTDTSNDNNGSVDQVWKLQRLTARHEVWLRVLFMVSSLFMERGNIYFELTAGGGKIGHKQCRAEDVDSAVWWYRAALGVLQPLADILCDCASGCTVLPLEPSLKVKEPDDQLNEAILGYIQMMERCYSVVSCSLFADVTLLLSKCYRFEHQVLESFIQLGMHRRAFLSVSVCVTGIHDWQIKRACCLVRLENPALARLIENYSANACIPCCDVSAMNAETLQDQQIQDEYQKLNKIVAKSKYANNMI